MSEADVIALLRRKRNSEEPELPEHCARAFARMGIKAGLNWEKELDGPPAAIFLQGLKAMVWRQAVKFPGPKNPPQASKETYFKFGMHGTDGPGLVGILTDRALKAGEASDGMGVYMKACERKPVSDPTAWDEIDRVASTMCEHNKNACGILVETTFAGLQHTCKGEGIDKEIALMRELGAGNHINQKGSKTSVERTLVHADDLRIDAFWYTPWLQQLPLDGCLPPPMVVPPIDFTSAQVAGASAWSYVPNSGFPAQQGGFGGWGHGLQQCVWGSAGQAGWSRHEPPFPLPPPVGASLVERYGLTGPAGSQPSGLLDQTWGASASPTHQDDGQTESPAQKPANHGCVDTSGCEPTPDEVVAAAAAPAEHSEEDPESIFVPRQCPSGLAALTQMQTPKQQHPMTEQVHAGPAPAASAGAHEPGTEAADTSAVLLSHAEASKLRDLPLHEAIRVRDFFRVMCDGEADNVDLSRIQSEVLDWRRWLAQVEKMSDDSIIGDGVVKFTFERPVCGGEPVLCGFVVHRKDGSQYRLCPKSREHGAVRLGSTQSSHAAARPVQALEAQPAQAAMSPQDGAAEAVAQATPPSKVLDSGSQPTASTEATDASGESRWHESQQHEPGAWKNYRTNNTTNQPWNQFNAGKPAYGGHTQTGYIKTTRAPHRADANWPRGGEAQGGAHRPALGSSTGRYPQNQGKQHCRWYPASGHAEQSVGSSRDGFAAPAMSGAAHTSDSGSLWNEEALQQTPQDQRVPRDWAREFLKSFGDETYRKDNNVSRMDLTCLKDEGDEGILFKDASGQQKRFFWRGWLANLSVDERQRLVGETGVRKVFMQWIDQYAKWGLLFVQGDGTEEHFW